MSLWDRIAKEQTSPPHPKQQATSVRSLPDDLLNSPPQTQVVNRPPVHQYPVHSTASAHTTAATPPPEEPPAPPESWLHKLNPLDWLPGWGTYISTGAAVALSVAETVGYPIPPTAYAIIAAFAGARLRRAVGRPGYYRAPS